MKAIDLDRFANDARACSISDRVSNLAHQGEHWPWPVLITLSKMEEDQAAERMADNLQQARKAHNANSHTNGLTHHDLYLKQWSNIQHELHKFNHNYWAPRKVVLV